MGGNKRGGEDREIPTFIPIVKCLGSLALKRSSTDIQEVAERPGWTEAARGGWGMTMASLSSILEILAKFSLSSLLTHSFMCPF